MECLRHHILLTMAKIDGQLNLLHVVIQGVTWLQNPKKCRQVSHTMSVKRHPGPRPLSKTTCPKQLPTLQLSAAGYRQYCTLRLLSQEREPSQSGYDPFARHERYSENVQPIIAALFMGERKNAAPKIGHVTPLHSLDDSERSWNLTSPRRQRVSHPKCFY